LAPRAADGRVSAPAPYWTDRRPHLGSVGAALAQRCFDLKWAAAQARQPRSDRNVGRSAGLNDRFGLPCRSNCHEIDTSILAETKLSER
jgi:hypothetical protein